MSKAAPRPKSVTAFGELLLRLNSRHHERFIQADTFTAHYTGAEANAAVSLAQWGIDTFAVSKVPDHEIGQACINCLRRFDINTDWVLRGPGRLGTLYVETGASQRPSKVIYDREHTCFREIRRGELDWDTILRGKDWFHFTGTAPALGPNVLAALRAGLRKAKEHGATVSFDCNYRSTLWTVEDARRVLKGLMQYVDVFIGTHHDARTLFGIDAEPAESAKRMRQQFGLESVAYTLRECPSASVNKLAGLLCVRDKCFTSRQYEMQIVDRIGGGDAFAAGLIYGMLSRRKPQYIIDFSVAASCLKHSIPGDFNLASVREVEQLMDGQETGRVQR
ncbi:PfkB family carbohydrate kinase [Verrucomicrobiota bacterium]